MAEGPWQKLDNVNSGAEDRMERLIVRDASRACLTRHLYGMMADLGGMEILLNQPKGVINNKRPRGRGGDRAADFPAPFVVDEPINADAR